jgi:hypothetical protein
MGEMPILEDWEASESAWQAAQADPDFFVVADMWNEWSRWSRVEASPWLVTANLLVEVTHTLLAFPQWCVYFALTEGGLTVFQDRILHEGPLFEGSSSIDELGTRCQSTRPEPSRRLEQARGPWPASPGDNRAETRFDSWQARKAPSPRAR